MWCASHHQRGKLGAGMLQNKRAGSIASWAPDVFFAKTTEKDARGVVAATAEGDAVTIS